jgi:DNA-binding MarR family transcriptional regulator
MIGPSDTLDAGALDVAEEQLWRATVRALLLMPTAVERDLRFASGLTLSMYAALLVLADAPGERMRMAQLADAAGIARSRLSRVVDRLETTGSVHRVAYEGDLRVYEVVLTERGRRRVITVQSRLAATVRSRLLAPVADAALNPATFAGLMARLAEASEPPR